MEERKMKKYSAIFAAVLAMAACEKVSEPSTITTEGAETRFVCSADTRISVGDKVGSTWNALWSAGDELSIVNVSDNSTLGTATLVSGEGQHSGIFATTAAITDGTSVRLVYGAASIKSAQVQAAPGAKDLSDVTYAESAAFPFTAGSTMNFTLSHSPAIVHVTVSSTDFADLQLTDVSLFSPTAALADDVTDRVGVSFTAPEALSGSQEAWFTAKPVDSASDFYAVATLKGTYNGVPDATVQIPVKFEGKTLTAGKVHGITIAANLSENDVDWYNPVCTRYIPMEGWCYGNTNCIMINPAASTTISFDFRAQGDFFNVMRYAKKPAKVKCFIADVVNTGTWTTWSVNGTQSSNKGIIALPADISAVQIGRSSAAIASSKTSVAGFFDILDSSENVIWKFSIWGTEPQEITLENGVIMDRNLGGYDPATGTQNQQGGLYFQWGRPFCFGYGSSIRPTTTAAVHTLAESAAQAENIVLRDDSSDSEFDFHWLRTTEVHVDLWGNTESYSASLGGKKSIFDPCPKGWKVISPALLTEIKDKASKATSPIKMLTFTEGGKTVVIPFAGQQKGNASGFAYSSGKNWSDRLSYFSDSAYKRRGYWLYVESIANDTDVLINNNRSSHVAAMRCMKDTANR